MNFLLLGLFLFNIANTSAVNVIAREDVMLSATSSNNLRRAAVEGKKLNASVGTKAMECKDECCGEKRDEDTCKTCLKEQGTGAFGSWNVSDDEKAREAYCEVANRGGGGSSEGADVNEVTFPGKWFTKLVDSLNSSMDQLEEKKTVEDVMGQVELYNSLKETVQKLKTNLESETSKGNASETQLAKENLREDFVKFVTQQESEYLEIYEKTEKGLRELKKHLTALQISRGEAMSEYLKTVQSIDSKKGTLEDFTREEEEQKQLLEEMSAQLNKQLEEARECSKEMRKETRKLNAKKRNSNTERDRLEKQIQADIKILEDKIDKSHSLPLVKISNPLLPGSKAHGETKLQEYEEKLEKDKEDFEKNIEDAVAGISASETSLKEAKTKTENLIQKGTENLTKIDKNINESRDVLGKMEDTVKDLFIDQNQKLTNIEEKENGLTSSSKTQAFEDAKKRIDEIDVSQLDNALSNLRQNEEQIRKDTEEVTDIETKLEASDPERVVSGEEFQKTLKSIEDIKAKADIEKLLNGEKFQAAKTEFNASNGEKFQAAKTEFNARSDTESIITYKGKDGNKYVGEAYSKIQDLLNSIETNYKKMQDLTQQGVEKIKNNTDELKTTLDQLTEQSAGRRRSEAIDTSKSELIKYKEELENQKTSITQSLNELKSELEKTDSEHQQLLTEAMEEYNLHLITIQGASEAIKTVLQAAESLLESKEQELQNMKTQVSNLSEALLNLVPPDCSNEREKFREIGEKIDTEVTNFNTSVSNMSEGVNSLSTMHDTYLEDEKELQKVCEEVRGTLQAHRETLQAHSLEDYKKCCITMDIKTAEEHKSCKSKVEKEKNTLEQEVSAERERKATASRDKIEAEANQQTIRNEVKTNCEAIADLLSQLTEDSEKEAKKGELTNYSECCDGKEAKATFDPDCRENLERDVEITDEWNV
eukprot:g5827.t1